MTREEAVKEIEKAFEPAFANYIITALTEGATVSDKEQGRMIAMGMTDKSLCNSCTNIGCEFQSGIVRTKCAFYMPPQSEPDNCGNYVVQDSTTKNDIRYNRVKNELNRVKDELESTTKNCESCKCHGSQHEVCNYCYKCSLWTEKEPTTKNNLGVDCISREQAKEAIRAKLKDLPSRVEINTILNELPSVTPQKPRKGEWTKLSNTIPCMNCPICGSTFTLMLGGDKMHYCPNCGADMRKVEDGNND